jgi:hypothetical protein
MTKNFNIPVVYFLILLISKEIFSYDSEKIVILCILTFIITAYYQVREGLYETFQARTAKLEEEFVVLLTLKAKLEKNLQNFWESFVILENQLVEILIWVKSNLKKFIIKANKNRSLFNFHIVKDQLNLLYKENLLVNYGLKSLQTKNTLYNFNLVLESKVDYATSDLTIMSALDQLKSSSNETTFNSLIANKLNVNKEIYFESGNWRSVNFNTYH